MASVQEILIILLFEIDILTARGLFDVYVMFDKFQLSFCMTGF